MFESGAILTTGREDRALPADRLRGRYVASSGWWSRAGLGPCSARTAISSSMRRTEPDAMERYRGEASRLYGVLDRQLGRTGAYVAGDEYSIADIACFPWTMTHKAKGSRSRTPNVSRWFARCARGQAAGGACDREIR